MEAIQPEGPVITPTGDALGADISGVDLREPLSYEVICRLQNAWAQHLVLRIKGQNLSDRQLIRFTEQFGILDEHPEHQGRERSGPDRWVVVISNIVENGVPLGALGYGEAAWHTDMSYNIVPPGGAFLLAREVPPEGGDTWFANMYAAYDALPARTKDRIGSLACIHDASRDSSGRLRPGFEHIDDPRDTPGARHPMVRVHPVTNRACLFLGRRAGAYVVGLSKTESEELLDELWTHATRPEFLWRQVWSVGDLVMWDNRCVLHHRSAFDGRHRRLMHRTQIKGEEVMPVHGKKHFAEAT